MAPDVSIIGAGPAGIAAAVQFGRYGLAAALFEKDKIGGLLRNARSVENYPGFPGGVSGTRLVRLFEKQLRASRVQVRFEDVVRLDHAGREFSIETDRSRLSVKIVVIATGTVPSRLPGLRPGAGLGRLIFYEVYPLLRARNKRIVIIGSGDAAFDYGLSLSPRNSVVICGRGRRPKCLPLLRDMAAGQRNLSYRPGAVLETIREHGRGLELTLARADGKERISADCLLVAIGRKPCLNFLSDALRKKARHLVEKKRLYMIGDVKNGIYRQTAICVGDGVRAAMEITRRTRREAQWT